MAEETARREIVARDDDRHDHAGEPGWSERVSFAFVDAMQALAVVATVELFPGEERGTASVVIFMPGGGVAMSMARAKVTGKGGTVVGPVGCYSDAPMKKWSVRCKDLALVFARASDATLSTTERSGAAAQIDVDLSFEASGAAVGEGVRRSVTETGFVSVYSSGLFQQAGSARGKVKIKTLELALDGSGARARAWGVHSARPCEWRVLGGAASLREVLSGNELSSEIGDARTPTDEILATVSPAPGVEVSLARFGEVSGILESHR